ncbi:MAG TPA: bifunctional 5,10-methylenetetrahydrofolate dehydrogenase/5,10-methenyltetrahydrofolate cyclohydrolase [Spirochaetota bacterium]|nr:bifunctional 5,10-methylenetetrahydrofolate dehydrogenase/5,10-methenyltetrahydrofolate cyclohydrolase [Spirochaetota bacterium]HOS40877.1 bifunctional 5,10-methylenetetrahydrofolate dehydrogenase/5,10-methenyltetrahydrofolate cyclohydrolase [Spirochaetota bacterium]HPU88817.1 bifunctional 5,10-methylenetetrahydrofolate dehydrogenase/5,10-methenyltetrahydrofolate cyclohydrolase [Spirochaetota bacterium]
MATIIDGNAIAAEIRGEIKNEVAAFVREGRTAPGLAVVLVGNDPASEVYVRNKGKDCVEVGITPHQHTLPAATTQDELIRLIDELNERSDVNGILVQLPLPKHINENTVLNRINPWKDADGFHPVNVGKTVIGESDAFFPCTPFGCQVMINRALRDIAGKHCVVVGRSNIVGKPIANMMVQKNKQANCIVTVCHTAAPDISYYTKQADILVVAAGRARFVTGAMVKEGVVVIDVGINRVDDPKNPGKTRLVGDVDFDSVEPKASAITPVPGGVGPMTRAMLLKNTMRAYRLQNGIA